MKTQSIFLALALILPCFFESGQWVRTNLPDTLAVSCLAVSGTNLFAGTSGGVFLSTDIGTSWTAVNTGLTNTSILSLLVSGTNIFAGTGGGVFLSTNYGASWASSSIGLTDPSELNVNALAVSGTNVFAGTNNGVFLSTNNGTIWTAANNGLPRSMWDSTRHVDIICFATKGQNLFAAVNDTSRVFLSTNSGSSWMKINAGLPGYIEALAVSGTNLFAGTINRGIFLSTNNGISWTPTGPALQMNFVPALAVSGTNIFAGTGTYKLGPPSIGVLLSTDIGTSWTTVNEGFPRASWDSTRYVSIRCFATSEQNLFAGTDAGLVRRPLSEMTSVEHSPTNVPTHFSLKQNYPNPFNPSTTIKFELSRASHASLCLYDLLGRELAVLLNEKRNAGVYEVKFDGSNLASGVYFYRLQAGDFIQTKKLVILK